HAPSTLEGAQRQRSASRVFHKIGGQLGDGQRNFLAGVPGKSRCQRGFLCRLLGSRAIEVFGDAEFGGFHFRGNQVRRHFRTVTLVPLPTTVSTFISSIRRFAPGIPIPSPPPVLCPSVIAALRSAMPGP